MNSIPPVYFFALGILIFSNSCKKDDTVTIPVFDAVKQASIDDSLLVKYFKDNKIDSVTKTTTGLYYKITKPGSDTVRIKKGNTVFVRYKLFFLDSTLVESNVDAAEAFKFFPGISSVIAAWQEGIPLFKKGEEGDLYLPSGLGYKNVAKGKVPANTCLRFTLKITNIE